MSRTLRLLFPFCRLASFAFPFDLGGCLLLRRFSRCIAEDFVPAADKLLRRTRVHGVPGHRDSFPDSKFKKQLSADNSTRTRFCALMIEASVPNPFTPNSTNMHRGKNHPHASRSTSLILYCGAPGLLDSSLGCRVTPDSSSLCRYSRTIATNCIGMIVTQVIIMIDESALWSLNRRCLWPFECLKSNQLG